MTEETVETALAESLPATETLLDDIMRGVGQLTEIGTANGIFLNCFAVNEEYCFECGTYSSRLVRIGAYEEVLAFSDA